MQENINSIERLRKIGFVIMQVVTMPVNFILTKLLRLKVYRPSHLRLTRGTLIIANHQSRIDPFLISHHIGIQNLMTTLPIRYPVTPDYMDAPIGFFIALLGGYSIGRTTMERLQKLIYTRTLLKQGYTIVIFPEGKIVRDHDMVADFQKGASVLFRENYPVVFVRLTGLNARNKFHFWKNKTTQLEYSDYLGPDVSMEEKMTAMAKFFDRESPAQYHNQT